LVPTAPLVAERFRRDASVLWPGILQRKFLAFSTRCRLFDFRALPDSPCPCRSAVSWQSWDPFLFSALQFTFRWTWKHANGLAVIDYISRALTSLWSLSQTRAKTFELVQVVAWDCHKLQAVSSEWSGSVVDFLLVNALKEFLKIYSLLPRNPIIARIILLSVFFV
jgi:hypothetical protein